MAIVLSTPQQPAVPHYDKVHLDSLVITLERNDAAKASIQAKVRPYYQDETGKKHFSTDHRDIFIDDAEAWAAQLAAQGDMRGAEAAGNINNIVQLLVEVETDFGAAEVVS